MKLTLDSKQLTSISICDTINKIQSGAFREPAASLYLVLGRIYVAYLLGFISDDCKKYIFHRVHRLIRDAKIL